MISRTAKYALEAALCLAAEVEGGPVPSGTLAERLSIPSDYLSRVLHTLRKRGVVDATRGRHGGFRLARSPSEVTLLDIVEPFDDVGDERQCLLRRQTCSDITACPLHEGWKSIAGAMASFFSQTTLAELEGMEPSPDRLAGSQR